MGLDCDVVAEKSGEEEEEEEEEGEKTKMPKNKVANKKP